MAEENRNDKIWEWQRRLRESKSVYAVWVRCDGESSLNALFESRERAERDADRYNANNQNGYLGTARVAAHHVISDVDADWWTQQLTEGE